MASPTAFSWILLAAVALRVIYTVGAAVATPDQLPFQHPDTEGYLEPAFDLVSFGTFTNRGQPELFRTPGYPLLLQLGVWLGAPEVVTIVLQVLLSAVTVAGVFVLAREVLEDERGALFAAAIYAVEPLSLIYTATLVTETYFTALVVWALFLLARYVRFRRPAALFAGVALIALAGYVRPIVYYLPAGLLALFAVDALTRRERRALYPLAAAAVLSFLIVLPWQLRNRALGFPGIASVSAVNMYFYNAAALRAAHHHTSFLAEQRAMGYPDLPNDSAYVAAHPAQRDWSLGERAAFQGKEGRREVLADVPRYALMHIVGMARVVADPGIFGALKTFRLYPAHGGLRDVVLSRGFAQGVLHLVRTSWPAIVLIIVFTGILAATYGLAVAGLTGRHEQVGERSGAGMASRARLGKRSVLLLLVVAAYFIVLSGGPVGEGRFRHPVMPIVCVFAGAGLAQILRRRAG